MLGVEHDYYPNLEVFFQLNVYPRKIVHPSMWGGVGGTCPPARVWGERSLGGGFGAASQKLKTDVKLPCKSIVISSQSGPFIR